MEKEKSRPHCLLSSFSLSFSSISLFLQAAQSFAKGGMECCGSGRTHPVGTGHHRGRLIREPRYSSAVRMVDWRGQAAYGDDSHRTLGSRIHHHRLHAWCCCGKRGWSSMSSHEWSHTDEWGRLLWHHWRAGSKLVHRWGATSWLTRQRQVVNVDVEAAYVTPSRRGQTASRWRTVSRSWARASLLFITRNKTMKRSSFTTKL